MANTKKFLTFVICMILISSFIGTSCFADSGIVMSGETLSGKPSADDLAVTKELRVKIPDDTKFLDSYKLVYINSADKYCTNAFEYPMNDYYLRQANAMFGSQAVELAECGDFSLVRYYTSGNRARTGWIETKYLTDEYPSFEYVIGNKASGGSYWSRGEELGSWSDKISIGAWMPGSTSFYINLDEDLPEVLQMTVDYQVLQRNKKEYTVTEGEREIFINDGNEWKKVGTFDFDEIRPVNAVVCFDEPTTVKSVAVVPTDRNNEGFPFKLAVTDIICKS